MSTVIGIWHLVLNGGEAKDFITPAAVQITNVSLGEEIADTNGRSVVKLSFGSLSPSDDDDDEVNDEKDDEDESAMTIVTTVLCSLIPGKIEQVALNVTLGSDEGYSLQVTGTNTVYFTGHYLDQRSPEDGFMDSEFDSDEDAYDLREVSSDVEMHPDDIEGLESDGRNVDSRFEEVKEEEVEKPTKRPRDSGEDSAGKPDKKKLKAEEGNAVPASSIPAQDKKKKEKKKPKQAEDKTEQQPQKDDSKQQAKGDKASKKTIAGGIVVQDSKIGTGPMAKKGDTVRMRYIGKLTSGKEFDKNTAGKPFTFNLGKGEVIKGWDEGIVGMQAGGERMLTIPPNMAYGKRGQEGIPPNSTLVFEVKLLGIK